jgi:hypothetical protein
MEEVVMKMPSTMGRAVQILDNLIEKTCSSYDLCNAKRQPGQEAAKTLMLEELLLIVAILSFKHVY